MTPQRHYRLSTHIVACKQILEYRVTMKFLEDPMRGLASVLFLVVSMNSVHAYEIVDGSSITRDAAQALQIMADTARDPASVQFRNLRDATNPDLAFCGEINAKNAMGGYTGFMPFSYQYDDDFFQVMDPSDSLAYQIAEATLKALGCLPS